MNVPIVECQAIRKKYRSRYVVAGVDARFDRGTTVVLGANGAGKTTLLSMLATTIRPTSGTITIGTLPVRGAAGVQRARRLVGFLPQRFDVMRGSTVEENVAYAAWAHGIKASDVGERSARALGAVGLEGRRAEKAKVLSGGQRQRLGIACAIAHNPKVVLLDEPSVGLDPIQRASLRTLITELGKDAVVILSTHLVDDAARLWNQALVLREGATIFNGPITDLTKRRADASGDPQEFEDALLELLQ